MSWDAIGAIGEAIGAAAVLVTLVFLILQLRQNTQAIRAESAREIFNQGTAWMYPLVHDPGIAKLYLAGLEDALESREDRLRFNLLMEALFNQWAIAYLHRADENLGYSDSNIAGVLSRPGGRAYWTRAKKEGLHTRAFVEHVASIERRIDGEA